MSAYIFVAVGGGSIGLLVGGVVTQSSNWHWIFFINIPIGLRHAAARPRAARGERGHRPRQGRRRARLDHGHGRADARHLRDRLDAGPRLGLGAHARSSAAPALALLAVFFALQARLANPIMPLRILRVPGPREHEHRARAARHGLFSTFFLGALYLERVRGYSALRTGVAFLPLSLAVGVLSAGITARLMARFGARRVMLPGLVLTAAGLLLMAASASTPATSRRCSSRS